MNRLLAAIALILVVPAYAPADLVDSVTFTNVESVTAPPEEPLNDIRFFSVTTTEPYELGPLTWSGLATPSQDPNPGEFGEFPSFGNELGVRIEHDQSAQAFELLLGEGQQYGPGPTEFTGSTLEFNGLTVNPGDSFSFTFFESFDDLQVDPDGIWNEITFNFDDDFINPPDPPGESIVRFDATGTQSLDTLPGEAGAEFYGITYGDGGDGLSITNVRLEGHDFGRVWFDQRETIGNFEVGDAGKFRVNSLTGVSEPTLTFLDEDPFFPQTYGTLELSFPEGDFGPGDGLRFGVLTRVPVLDFSANGADLSQLEVGGPLSMTLTLEDGTKVTAPLVDPTPGVPVSSFADLDLAASMAPTGGDTDGDGDVDGHDLMQVVQNLGTPAFATPADGDVDGQGDVDDDDLAITLNAYGLRNLEQVALGSSVPEPASILLALLIAPVAWRCTRRISAR